MQNTTPEVDSSSTISSSKSSFKVPQITEKELTSSIMSKTLDALKKETIPCFNPAETKFMIQQCEEQVMTYVSDGGDPEIILKKGDVKLDIKNPNKILKKVDEIRNEQRIEESTKEQKRREEELKKKVNQRIKETKDEILEARESSYKNLPDDCCSMRSRFKKMISLKPNGLSELSEETKKSVGFDNSVKNPNFFEETLKESQQKIKEAITGVLKTNTTSSNSDKIQKLLEPLSSWTVRELLDDPNAMKLLDSEDLCKKIIGSSLEKEETPKPANKNAYEIRADVLGIAADLTKFRYTENPHLITTDLVLQSAQNLYKFVENKR